MTLPHERTRAVLALEAEVHELAQLLQRSKAAKVAVPRERLRALAGWLRHYPTSFDIARSAEALPDVWGPPP